MVAKERHFSSIYYAEGVMVAVKALENVARVLFLLLLLIGIIFHLTDLLFLLAFVTVPAVALGYLAWQIRSIRQAGRFFQTLAGAIHRGNNHLRAPPDILHYDIEVDRLMRDVMAQTVTPTQRALVRVFRQVKAVGLNENVRPVLEEDSVIRQEIRHANRRILSAVEDQDRYVLFSELGRLYALYARESLPDAEVDEAPPDRGDLDEHLISLLKSVAADVYRGRLLYLPAQVAALSRVLVRAPATPTNNFAILLLFWVRSKLFELRSQPEQPESAIWASENERLAQRIYQAAVEYERGNLDETVRAICQSYDPTQRTFRFLTPPPGRTVPAHLHHILQRAADIR